MGLLIVKSKCLLALSHLRHYAKMQNRRSSAAQYLMSRVPVGEELPGADQEREYHRRQGGGGGRGGVAEVEVAVAELLGPLPVTVRLAFLVVNFVFRGAAAPRDAALW